MTLFGTNTTLNKANNVFIGLNNNTFPNPLTNSNNFGNDIKLFNQVSQPKINLNIINPENKNILNNNSTNIINNFNNCIGYKNNNLDINNIISSNLQNTNNIINKEELKTNTLNLPSFPSFFNDNKENLKNNIKTNKEKNALENNNINSNNILVNMFNGLSNPLNTNINIEKKENMLNSKEQIKINSLNNNLLYNYAESINRLLFPGLNQFSILSSVLNNNIFTNPINTINPINYSIMKIPQINNNIFETQKIDNKERNINDVNELLGKKRD